MRKFFYTLLGNFSTHLIRKFFGLEEALHDHEALPRRVEFPNHGVAVEIG
jgi:hypothetical protein